MPASGVTGTKFTDSASYLQSTTFIHNLQQLLNTVSFYHHFVVGCQFLTLRFPLNATCVITRCRPNGRNRTGPPCSVDRPIAHAPCGRPARPLAVLQTTTDDREQNNTGPLGGPVISSTAFLSSPAVTTTTVSDRYIRYSYYCRCFSDSNGGSTCLTVSFLYVLCYISYRMQTNCTLDGDDDECCSGKPVRLRQRLPEETSTCLGDSSSTFTCTATSIVFRVRSACNG